jgi:hypothetical protein
MKFIGSIYGDGENHQTKHNLLDLTLEIEQQKQNNIKLEGNEKRNLHF